MSPSPATFHAQLADLTRQLAGRALDADPERWLNAEYGVDSPTFRALFDSCRAGVAEAWLCTREDGGIRHGRVFKPQAELARFSVDVVDMKDVAGPHHPSKW